MSSNKTADTKWSILPSSWYQSLNYLDCYQHPTWEGHFSFCHICPPEFSILHLSVCALWFLSCLVYSYSKTSLVSCCLLISFRARGNAMMFPYLACKRWGMQNSATCNDKMTEYAKSHPSTGTQRALKRHICSVSLVPQCLILMVLVHLKQTLYNTHIPLKYWRNLK